MNAIKQKLEAMNGHKPTKAEYKDLCKQIKSEAKRRAAIPDIMNRPGKWSITRTIREIVKSVRYILKVRKNQRRVYRNMERMRAAAIKRHGGAA